MSFWSSFKMDNTVKKEERREHVSENSEKYEKLWRK
jgi:hypothetical protein